MRRRYPVVVGGLLTAAVVVAALWTSCAGDSARTGPAPGVTRNVTSSEPPPRATTRVHTGAAPVSPEAAAAPPARPEETPAPAAERQAGPARDIDVFVTDEGGTPIGGVWTYLDADASGARAQGRTDEHGAVRFRAAAGPRTIDVAEKIVPGHAFLPVGVVTVGATDSEVRIRLREGAAIEGRVLDETGAPVDHVNVCVLGPDGFRNNITTAKDGAFRLPAPVDSTCDVRIGLAGAEWWPDMNFEGSVEGVRAGSNGVVLRCRRVAFDRKLSVVVVDPDGSPVPGAYVAVLLRAVVQGGNTDADGRCRFEGLPDRELTVGASSLGAGARDVYAPSRRVQVVPDGQEIVVQLRRAHQVRVALVDASGAAVAVRGVRLNARHAEADFAWAESDESGRLVLRIPADSPGLWHLATSDDSRVADVRGAADVTVPTDAEVRLVVERVPK
jgi:carboxypeptidase family protein